MVALPATRPVYICRQKPPHIAPPPVVSRCVNHNGDKGTQVCSRNIVGVHVRGLLVEIRRLASVSVRTRRPTPISKGLEGWIRYCHSPKLRPHPCHYAATRS